MGLIKDNEKFTICRFNESFQREVINIIGVGNCLQSRYNYELGSKLFMRPSASNRSLHTI